MIYDFNSVGGGGGVKTKCFPILMKFGVWNLFCVPNSNLKLIFDKFFVFALFRGYLGAKKAKITFLGLNVNVA